MHLRHCPHHVINNLTICNEISRAYAFAATTQTPSFVGNYIHKPMEKKTTLIALICLLLAAIIAPTAASAQSDLTPEEITFLKSLNGKWNPNADDSSKWGTWCYHITLRYVNGMIKVSYPASVMIKDKERSVMSTKVANAYYDSSTQYLKITYDHHILDLDDDDEDFRNLDVTVSLSIPFQTDIEDMFVAERTTRYSNVGGWKKSEEVIYYKR